MLTRTSSKATSLRRTLPLSDNLSRAMLLWNKNTRTTKPKTSKLTCSAKSVLHQNWESAPLQRVPALLHKNGPPLPVLAQLCGHAQSAPLCLTFCYCVDWQCSVPHLRLFDQGPRNVEHSILGCPDSSRSGPHLLHSNVQRLSVIFGVDVQPGHHHAWSVQTRPALHHFLWPLIQCQTLRLLWYSIPLEIPTPAICWPANQRTRVRAWIFERQFWRHLRTPGKILELVTRKSSQLYVLCVLMLRMKHSHWI